MNTYKWLLKREFWEHKGGFLWAQVVVGTLIALGLTISASIMTAIGSKHGMQINGEQVTNLGHVVSPEQKLEMIQGLSSGYMFVSAPMFIVLAVVVFFYSLGCLFDERKDRSILFWKSLPVSDSETVLSKVGMALIVAPVITLVAAFATSLFVLIACCILAAVSGLNLFAVFAMPGTWTFPFEVAAVLPVYLVWALPTIGWLMMCSAWARTKVFLWAVGVPVLAGILISWFEAIFDTGLNVQWFWKNIVARGLLSVVPGTWFGFSDGNGGLHVDKGHMHIGDLAISSYQAMGAPTVWLGAAAGVAMIYAATRIRRWKDEG
jgi:ABC-2 type transport system permease protein